MLCFSVSIWLKFNVLFELLWRLQTLRDQGGWWQHLTFTHRCHWFLWLLTFYVSWFILARRKISPICGEKVWLSWSWWNISLWHVKLDFYWANNRIGYACQLLAVQPMRNKRWKAQHWNCCVPLQDILFVWWGAKHKGRGHKCPFSCNMAGNALRQADVLKTSCCCCSFIFIADTDLTFRDSWRGNVGVFYLLHTKCKVTQINRLFTKRHLVKMMYD